jgi:hypothetical protein
MDESKGFQVQPSLEVAFILRIIEGDFSPRMALEVGAPPWWKVGTNQRFPHFSMAQRQKVNTPDLSITMS